MRALSTIFSPALAIFATGLLAGAAMAQGRTGSLVNGTDIEIVYQAGVPDAQGAVAWETYELAPCEAHAWSWDQSGDPNVAMIWPRHVDQRKDEYDNILMERTVIPMTAQGATTVFFLYGDQIWINTTGDNPCDAR